MYMQSTAHAYCDRDVPVIPSTLLYTNKVLYSRLQYLFQQKSVDPLIIFIIFIIFSDNSGTISPIASPRHSTGGPLKQRLDSWHMFNIFLLPPGSSRAEYRSLLISSGDRQGVRLQC